MKTSFFYLLLLPFLFLSCEDDDRPLNNNPYFQNPIVNFTINLNLPEYNALNFTNNSVVVSQQGISGIVVYNFNDDLFLAFDLADPNHELLDCSQMEVEGIIATCPCDSDDNSYFLTSGEHQQQTEALFPMIQYRVRKDGNILRISN